MKRFKLFWKVVILMLCVSLLPSCDLKEETTIITEITATEVTTAHEETTVYKETTVHEGITVHEETTVNRETTTNEEMTVFEETTNSEETETNDEATVDEGTTAKEETTVHEHCIVIDEAVEPTCTETGLTVGAHCSFCNDILVKQNTISAKGHKEIIDTLIPATPDREGLTEGKHCEICGEILIAQQIIPKPSNIIKFNTSDIDFVFIDSGKTHLASPLSCDYQISKYSYSASCSYTYIDTNFETPDEHMISFKLTIKFKCVTGHRYIRIGYVITDSSGNEIDISTIMDTAGQTSSYISGRYYTLTETIMLPAVAEVYTITFS